MDLKCIRMISVVLLLATSEVSMSIDVVDCDMSEYDDESQIVNCNGINLKIIPKTLPKNIKHLDLSDNNLRVLVNGTFSRYHILERLIVSHSETEIIESKAFNGLRMLRSINLSYNKIVSVAPETFEYNTVLERLSLEGNPLVYLSKSFPLLISQSIRVLNLNSCSLIEVYPVTFSKLPKLKILDLSSNNLENISPDIFGGLLELWKVELGNNRFKCTCDIVQAMNLVDGRRRGVSHHSPVRCVENGKYKTWWTAINGGKEGCKEVIEVTTETDTYPPAHLYNGAQTSVTDIWTTKDITVQERTTSERLVIDSFSNEMLPYTTTSPPHQDVPPPANQDQQLLQQKITSTSHYEVVTSPDSLETSDGTANYSSRAPEAKESDTIFAFSGTTFAIFLLPLVATISVFVVILGKKYCIKLNSNPHPMEEKAEEGTLEVSFHSKCRLLNEYSESNDVVECTGDSSK